MLCRWDETSYVNRWPWDIAGMHTGMQALPCGGGGGTRHRYGKVYLHCHVSSLRYCRHVNRETHVAM